MVKCRKGGEELVVGLNWLPSNAKVHSYICRSCQNDYQRQRNSMPETKNLRNIGHARNMQVPEFASKYTTYRKTRYAKFSARAMDMLGGKCIHCGENDRRFLTFGHINNDGAEWRKRISMEGVKWIVENLQEARAIFQIECYNFNYSKAFWVGEVVDYKMLPSKINGKKNPEYDRALRQYYRAKCFDHYGWMCACCGDNDPSHLSLGHLNNDGWKHRKEVGGGSSEICRRLVKSNFKTPYVIQTQCFNCNMASEHNGGKCPHA